jgi:membrane-associated phospholipid phosphatase
VDAIETSASGQRQHRTFWWKEALIMGVFYLFYAWSRNLFGSAYISLETGDTPLRAFRNAERIIQLERAIGLFHEESVQDWFLPFLGFIRFWNTYYGTAHFLVTFAVFWILFVKRKDVFPQWRNTLAITTALAIIGFSLFPLMPPRLLDSPCPAQGGFGGACIESRYRDEGADGIRGTDDDGSFGFVDTLLEYGGALWTFESTAMKSISNQYAAMPSMHIGWSSWCAFALWPLMRRRWAKIAVLLYPAATLFCIVVTGNHYWIDGVGGQLALAIGAWAGWALHRQNQRRLDRKFFAAATVEPVSLSD